MKTLLKAFFVLVLAGMIAVTTWASLDRGVWIAGDGLWPDRWFAATLADAYFGFLTFYVWVAYKEQGWARRLGWLVAILALGNMAMALYAVLQLSRLKPGEPLENALLRSPQPGRHA